MMHIFSGIYKNRKILAPKGEETRPTSGRLREALFNICQKDIEGANFLDLFAGSGAMGLEALSRGAKYVTFVDNSRESIRCIRSNLSTFDIERSGEVIYSDVFDALKKLAKKGSCFDMIYADPPYGNIVEGNHGPISFSTKVLFVIEELMEKGQSLLKPGGKLFLEDALNSLPEGVVLKHLVFKDRRNMGKSALQQWELIKE